MVAGLRDENEPATGGCAWQESRPETSRPLVDLDDLYTDWDIDQLAETLRGMLEEAKQ
jgi:hypothetical protein